MSMDNHIARWREIVYATQRGKTVWNIPVSSTGMYDCILTLGFDEDGEPDLSTGIEEQSKMCAHCLFVTDEPHNFGDIIEPTQYDGDCDECGYVPFHDQVLGRDLFWIGEEE